jgi:GT2 family glycosyltransferase
MFKMSVVETKKLPVVAAIPNYNMGQQLAELLPELAAQDYSDIFVLDDGSTDNSREVVESFNTGSGVHFIANRENRGAAAARNRIIPALGYNALIHFVDSDITLETEDVVAVIHDIAPVEPFGFIGGLAKTLNGMQNAWNYGPHQDIPSHIAAQIQARIEQCMVNQPDKARAIHRRFAKLLEGYPFPLDEPAPKKIFWATEQNLLVRSDIFKSVGGFDPTLREHEIQGLAIRMHTMGLPRYFNPAVSVVHKDQQNVRNYNRKIARNVTELRIAHLHGLKNYLFPGDRFKVEQLAE